MHFKRGSTYKEPRAGKLFLFAMVSQDMADVLAKETLNAFAKFLYAIHIALVHFPLDSGARLERRNFLIYFEVPGDVGDQILDHREGLHGEDGDGFIKRKRVHTGLAGEPWPAIHLGRARTALSGLAVPAHGQVGCLVRLDRMQCIEHHHARDKRYTIVDGRSTFFVAPEDPQRRICERALSHGQPPLLSSTIFCQQLLQIVRHLKERGFDEGHRASFLDHDIMLLSPGIVQTGVVNAAMGTTALTACKRAAGHRFGDSQHAMQVPRKVPSGVEEPRAFNAHASDTRLQLIELREGTVEVFLVSKDAYKALHGALQVFVNGIGAFAIRTLEWSEQLPYRFFDLRIINRGCHASLGVLCRR